MKILKVISVVTGSISFTALAVTPFLYESGTLDLVQAVKIIALSTVVVFASKFTYSILKEKRLAGRQSKQGTHKNIRVNYNISGGKME